MKLFLLIWSIAASGWWVMALLLLAKSRRQSQAPTPAARASVAVFKPLPPIRSEPERNRLAEAIASFVTQLKANDEILLGVDEADAAAWQKYFQVWRGLNPTARIQVLAQPFPRQCSNPKIAWLQVLAPLSQSEVWIWSDADVTAPAELLDEMCHQLVASGSNAVTVPYRIQEVHRAHEMLDALFVNVEFLPGTMLIGRLKHQDFAYGSATAFRAETFQAKGNWQELGDALADDHKLGELLQPVTLANALVSTLPCRGGWCPAWLHYYRWHKTVRWCRPTGYAALLLVLPGIGWALAGLISLAWGKPAAFYGIGCGATLIEEALVGFVACRLLGCPLPVGTWLGVLSWPLFRAMSWFLVWLPIPVFWQGQKPAWFSPRKETKTDAASNIPSPPEAVQRSLDNNRAVR